MQVGQDAILRGGWLPPLSPANATLGRLPNRPQLTQLPHLYVPHKQRQPIFINHGLE